MSLYSCSAAALAMIGFVATIGGSKPPRQQAQSSFLETHLLVTWYGNPNCPQMGVLGRAAGNARADALRRQAAAYARFTAKEIAMAYHLVAVVAQSSPCADRTWRRRESSQVIRSLLLEAREHGFRLILDVQPGRAEMASELAHLQPFLAEPDVYLALDPEYEMTEGQRPGRQIGHMHAEDVNAAVDFLGALVRERHLPAKVLIVHQFTLAMLPDKDEIHRAAGVDLVLDMDGFGSQELKRSSYRAIMRQRPLDFAGIKLFYQQDTGLFSAQQVMALAPVPSVVVYQ